MEIRHEGTTLQLRPLVLLETKQQASGVDSNPLTLSF